MTDVDKNVRAFGNRFLRNASNEPDTHGLRGDLEYLIYALGSDKDGHVPPGLGLFTQLQVMIGQGENAESTSLELAKCYCDVVKDRDLQLLAYILNEPQILKHEVSRCGSREFTDYRTLSCDIANDRFR